MSLTFLRSQHPLDKKREMKHSIRLKIQSRGCHWQNALARVRGVAQGKVGVHRKKPRECRSDSSKTVWLGWVLI